MRHPQSLVEEVRAKAAFATPMQLSHQYKLPVSTIRDWLNNVVRSGVDRNRPFARRGEKPGPGQLPYSPPSALAKAQTHAVQMRITGPDAGRLQGTSPGATVGLVVHVLR